MANSLLFPEPTLADPVVPSFGTYAAYGVLVLFGLIVVVFIGYTIMRRFSRPELYGLTREQIAERLKMARKTAEQGHMGAKLAVMEGDALLDAALKSMMIQGETLGERLKVACFKYEKLRNVWWAHKLRNQIAHEPSFQVSSRQARQALDEFERALKTLNIL
ncbi:hypothetical protein KBC59_04235 [Patescibacteria group bacterium]|jgi:hypothetical protein|nr:hypothetical protein [Patescibacteria group bacterium]